MDYLYDGTYSGLLCCIYAHYHQEKATGIFCEENYQASLLTPFYHLPTEEEKAEKVYRAISEKLGAFTLRRSYLTYLSSVSEKEMKLLNYLTFGFQTGPHFNHLHGNSAVFEVQSIEKKLYTERHRYNGLLRFSVISSNANMQSNAFETEKEILYASLEPDHDILEIMAEHFIDRYRKEPFILHDVKREKAIFANNGEWYISSLKKNVSLTFSTNENFYQKMWKQYFDAIAIKQRTNLNCQKNFMPQRYWNHLTEKQVYFSNEET